MNNNYIFFVLGMPFTKCNGSQFTEGECDKDVPANGRQSARYFCDDCAAAIKEATK